MHDNTDFTSQNPYASSVPVPLDSEIVRLPMGAIALAILFLLMGGLMAIGCVLRTWEISNYNLPLLVALRMAIRVLLIGLISATALAAGIGLLIGRARGWWAAMVGCYCMCCLLVVVPLLHGNISLARLIPLAILGFVWRFLHTSKVMRYYQVASQTLRRRHIAAALLCLAVTICLGIW